MKYFNAEEKELLFKQIYREEGRHRKRNIAIFEVAKYCALRASEISNLKLGFYDRSSSTLYCQRLKGSNSNTLMIVDPYVRKALNDYLDERENLSIVSQNLFVSQKGFPISRQRMDALMKYYCSQTNAIPQYKWHMHVLRHSRVIELIESGFDVNDVQYWLGHKNSENTFKYLEFTPALKQTLFKKLAALEGSEKSCGDRYPLDDSHMA